MKKGSAHTLNAMILTGCLLLLFPLFTASADAAGEGEPDWGDAYTITGEDGRTHTYFVDENGGYSTIVDDEPVIWLYTEITDEQGRIGAPASEKLWFGIRNSGADGQGFFREGSRFSVRFVGTDNAELWYEYRGLLDASVKKKLYEGHSMFCVISVTDPDGSEYKGLPDVAELYVSADLMLFDEEGSLLLHDCRSLPTDGVDCPLSGAYNVFSLYHLGTPLVVDDSDYQSGSVISDAVTPASAVIVGVTALAAGLVIGFSVRRRRSATAKDSEDEENE